MRWRYQAQLLAWTSRGVSTSVLPRARRDCDLMFLVEPGCVVRPWINARDIQSIQCLHAFGLLRAGFRPPDSLRVIRAYRRRRQMRMRYAISHAQHMQNAPQEITVTLANFGHRKDQSR